MSSGAAIALTVSQATSIGARPRSAECLTRVRGRQPVREAMAVKETCPLVGSSNCRGVRPLGPDSP